MKKGLKFKLLENYIKEVAVNQGQTINRIAVQNEDTLPLSPEDETIKGDALNIAKEFSEMNKGILTIKDSYDKNGKSDLKRFAREVFGDPFANLTKTAEIAYEIAENIMLKIKVGGKKDLAIFKSIMDELTKLAPEAKKAIEELIGKYNELKEIDDTIETQAVNEDFAQEFKKQLSDLKSWATKFNYKTEHLKNRVNQLQYKFKNPRLFSK